MLPLGILNASTKNERITRNKASAMTTERNQSQANRSPERRLPFAVLSAPRAPFFTHHHYRVVSSVRHH